MPDPSDRELRAVFDALPAMVGYWGRDLRNRVSNDAYVDYFGLDPEALLGMHIRDVLGAALYTQNEPFIRRVLAGERQQFDRTIVSAAGEPRYTQASYIPDVVDGEVRGFSVLVTDITGRRRAEAAQAAAERRFRALFEMAPIGTFLLSCDGLIVDLNQAATALLDRPRDALIGDSFTTFTHPADVDASRTAFDALLSGQSDSYRLEARSMRGDGVMIWTQLDVARFVEEGGSVTILAQVQDVSDRRAHQDALERLATHDPLTGLLNRRGFLRQLDAYRTTKAHEGLGSIAVIDLNDFKTLNDTFGHAAGDAALEQVAAILTARVRSDDAIARLGGDEFAILLAGAQGEAAQLVATELADAIGAARLGVPSCPVTAAFGVANIDASVSSEAIVDLSDRAMYRHKRAGRGGAGVRR